MNRDCSTLPFKITINQEFLLEHKILEMEERHKEELGTLKEEKGNLQVLVSRQSYIIQELERQLSKATTNNSIMQKQQLELMDTVHSLVSICSKDGVLLKNAKKEEEKPFRDCADAYQAGFNKSGVYTIYVTNISEPKKVFCNMETAGGGWTVIQHREDGSLDFQKIEIQTSTLDSSKWNSRWRLIART
uniref:Angiopoietin 1 n=1 Tax=Laticauda laticaudata TaxID=8630 RepID=A0A8C5WWN0_LATLA